MNFSSSKRKISEGSKRNFIAQPPLNLTVPIAANEYINNEVLIQSPQSLQSFYVPNSYESTLSQQSNQAMQSPFNTKLVATSGISDSSQTEDAPTKLKMKASRVCKPGPVLASNKRLPSCLLIGDSITLG